MQSLGERARRVGGQQVAADQIGGSLAGDGQFVLEGRGESGGARGQEVGKRVSARSSTPSTKLIIKPYATSIARHHGAAVDFTA
ncbi:hypothetical protein GCM10012286_19510 [Streptomyces lasiicapitis]|uniref:Uncharacterized protein n=1 Tax=Streptomyces lasiicapitis TaxID=1923961 RepID=A0ABQ2LNN2_9ACTN|nr:hypothetical protein GCM10012286_19510 [Streptomyces lasiicapitis]